MSNRNRDAGNGYERIACKIWEYLLDRKVRTTRETSRFKDAHCIDLDNTDPFQVQIKKQMQIPDMVKIFETMNKYDDSKINLIQWAKTKRAEKNIVTTGEYIIMPLKDFEAMHEHLTSKA